MDAIDRRLIEILQANARTPTALIARMVGLSRSTVQFRLARLERTGIIAGYGVRLGQAAPRHRLTAHVAISVHPKHGERVVAALKTMSGVRTLYAVSGLHDLIAVLMAETTGEIDALLDRIGQLPGIEKTTSSIVLSTKFERPQEG
jgi:DNA-binding Lrp family transcriptional regulator